ncbi:hypothetical protein STEG23_032620, partial [Scotinomys teguina]
MARKAGQWEEEEVAQSHEEEERCQLAKKRRCRVTGCELCCLNWMCHALLTPMEGPHFLNGDGGEKRYYLKLLQPGPEGVRMMFYMMKPSETAFPTVEEVPDYVKKATPFFISLILLELVISWILKGKPPGRLDDILTSMSAGVVSRLP